jgi:hypothetical protein
VIKILTELLLGGYFCPSMFVQWNKFNLGVFMPYQADDAYKAWSRLIELYQINMCWSCYIS